MLRALLFPLLAVFAASVLAQPKPGCDFAESKQFDFWLGEWDAAYRKQDGSVGKSRNRGVEWLVVVAVSRPAFTVTMPELPSIANRPPALLSSE